LARLGFVVAFERDGLSEAAGDSFESEVSGFEVSEPEVEVLLSPELSALSGSEAKLRASTGFKMSGTEGLDGAELNVSGVAGSVVDGSADWAD